MSAWFEARDLLSTGAISANPTPSRKIWKRLLRHHIRRRVQQEDYSSDHLGPTKIPSEHHDPKPVGLSEYGMGAHGSQLTY